MPANPNESGKGFRSPAIQRLGRKASNGARKLSYSSSQLEMPTLTSQRYFSSPFSNQHNSISDFILSRRGFRKAHLNINSLYLTKHIDELRILLFDYSIDIISINETKLDDTIKSCEVHITGYEFIRRDRNRQGGGVDFYIKTSINFGLCYNPNVPNLENLCIKIRKPISRAISDSYMV